MTMREEVKKVLEMLEQGKINATQAAELLEAMQVMDDARPAATAADSPRRMLKIKVISDDGDNVDIKIPMTLVSAGLSLGKNFAGKASGDNEALKDLDWDQLNVAINQMLADGTIGDIVTVDSKNGESVRIWLE
jgi:hypothetical protein